MCRDGEDTRQHLVACSEQYLRRRTVDGYAGSSAEELAAEQQQPLSSGATFEKQGLPGSGAGLSEHPPTYDIQVHRLHLLLTSQMTFLISPWGIDICMPSYAPSG